MRAFWLRAIWPRVLGAILAEMREIALVVPGAAIVGRAPRQEIRHLARLDLGGACLKRRDAREKARWMGVAVVTVVVSGLARAVANRAHGE